jgi:hypothetical protein
LASSNKAGLADYMRARNLARNAVQQLIMLSGVDPAHVVIDGSARELWEGVHDIVLVSPEGSEVVLIEHNCLMDAALFREQAIPLIRDAIQKLQRRHWK